MRMILLLIFLTSCSQKYQTYHVIDKENFSKEDPEVPVTKKMRVGEKSTRSYCEGQVLFFSNAKKRTDQYLDQLVRIVCPNDRYLVQTRLTETWWTTILYSRSCIELETHCPRN